jgi:hypothetical protein
VKPKATPAPVRPPKPIPAQPGTAQAGTKTARLIAALYEGGTVAELAEASGYDERNCRTAIGILRTRKGLDVTQDPNTKMYHLRRPQ